MIRYRPVRELLADAMDEMMVFNNADELKDFIIKDNLVFGYLIKKDDIICECQRYDERIGWDSHIISIKNYGAVGYTDSPI